MNEVTKLYENAGIELRCNIYPTFYDCSTYPHEKCEDCVEWEYPPFTAEKQLSLIKWLDKSKNGFGFFNDGTEGLSCHCDFHWEWFNENFYAEDFDNALAGLINNLWQDLTEEERKQIRGILE